VMASGVRAERHQWSRSGRRWQYERRVRPLTTTPVSIRQKPRHRVLILPRSPTMPRTAARIAASGRLPCPTRYPLTSLGELAERTRRPGQPVSPAPGCPATDAGRESAAAAWGRRRRSMTRCRTSGEPGSLIVGLYFSQGSFVSFFI